MRKIIYKVKRFLSVCLAPLFRRKEPESLCCKCGKNPAHVYVLIEEGALYTELCFDCFFSLFEGQEEQNG